MMICDTLLKHFNNSYSIIINIKLTKLLFNVKRTYINVLINIFYAPAKI